MPYFVPMLIGCWLVLSMLWPIHVFRHHHGMLILQNSIAHFTALKRAAAGEIRPAKKLKKGK